MLFWAATIVDVAAACGDVSHAALSGDWQLLVTVEPPATAFSQFPAGHQAIDKVHFQSACPTAETCKVEIEPPNSPGIQFYSNTTGIYAPDPSSPLVQSGDTYTSNYFSGGVGGPNLPPCPPPRLTYAMTLRIAEAARDTTGPGWHATIVVGQEDVPGLWTCAGGVGVAGPVGHLAILAVPVGDSLPAQAPNSTCTVSAPVGPASATAVALPAGQGPSTIASALATPADVFASLPTVIAGALITIAVLLFVTFPSQIFNKTLEENYKEIRAIARRQFPWVRRLQHSIRRGGAGRRNAVAFVGVILLGAVLGGLNDPGFGFNRSSAASYVAVILAILFGIALSGSVGLLYRLARKRDRTATPHALPAGLLVAATCVLLSRLTSFTPGYLYGVICGLAFTVKLPPNESGHNVALATVATLSTGVVAWFGWLAVNDAAHLADAGFALVVFDDFLASVFVGSLVGSVIGLFPLRFLPGGTLAAWSRIAWAVTFAVATFGLVAVMLRPTTTAGHSGKAPLVTAILLFVVFGGASVAFRMYFNALRRRRAEAKRARFG